MKEPIKQDSINFTVDKTENSVTIFVNPKIFPVPCIMATLKNFVDKSYVLVDENPPGKIAVKLIFFDKNADLEKVCYEFNTNLVASFVTSGPNQRF